MSLRLLLLLALVAVLVAGATSSKDKKPGPGHHAKPGGGPKRNSRESKEHAKHKPGAGPKRDSRESKEHGKSKPKPKPGPGPKPPHGPVVVGPGQGPKPPVRPSPVAQVDGPGACHVCYANGSMHLVAPESNCTRYYSQSLLHPHFATLSVCPKGQVFNATVCACSAVNSRPCTCSARIGGGSSSGVTQKPNPGSTLATAAPHTTPSGKRECSCRRGLSLYVPDWNLGCRSYAEVFRNNHTKKHSCPNNQLFNIDKCTCERSDKVNCSCAEMATQPPPQEKMFCSHGDYIYRQVPRSGCKNFTIEARFLQPIMFSCPVHFVFDVDTCSCILAALLANHARCHDHGITWPTHPSNRTVTPTPWTPSHKCHCSQYGVTYEPVNECRSFLQSANGTGVRQIDCPRGLLFNVDWCVCDRATNVRCRTCTQPVPSHPPRHHGAECHACAAGGNVYRQVIDTGCKKFSQASATSVTAVHTCPGNQLFDPRTCVCNHPEAVHCTCSGNVTAAVNHAPAAAAAGGVGWAPGHGHPDRGIPGYDKPGCSCVANGNRYRPVESCRAFTQASVTAPSAIARHSCPVGLLFNTDKCICDWPASTRCHDCAGPHRPK